MSEKLSVQLEIAARILSDFKNTEMANTCKKAHAIVKAWEDAPVRIIHRLYGRTDDPEDSNHLIKKMGGKRVRLVIEE